MPGFSPPMYPKHDPNKSVLAVLKKYDLDDILDEVMYWIEREPVGAGTLKKRFIESFAFTPPTGDPPDFFEIDLKDPMTWGELPPERPMPSDQFFLDLYKAIVADEKRNAKRSSYEF